MGRIPILLDGDPGHDDAMAMTLALASDELEVKGMTVVAGNSTLQNTSTNAIRVLEWLGRTDIQVVKGASQPLSRELSIADSVHGESGLDGPVFPPITHQSLDVNFCDFMADIVRKSDEKVAIVAMGPLTNTAIFLLSNPDLHDKIRCISLMGGAAIGGNWSPTAEFNIWEDAEAARVVFDSGIPIIMCGLDATNKARVTAEEIEQFHQIGTKGGDLIAGLMDFFKDHDLPGTNFKEVPMHDAVAVAALLSDTPVKLEDMYVTVDIDGGYTQGCTVCDILGLTGKAPNAKVAMDLDREKFVGMLADACRKFK
ncbi:nucleoside hydrolase [Neobittarella massiliensis]|uniref:Nucleoside hydrolase n=1 Tax=Neobittarella massiliensis (ex Bilen et al. 2018) TaxID=2041842 RepID=A0A8J6LU55_9FIRM|nr:nucleoside hydrolase [Neobittarella massiliensis]MBC3516289.1 nucleoside hydrolase [Neobittarella massiliensis]